MLRGRRRGRGGSAGAGVAVGPTWTDNSDGTATIHVTFDRAVYCGIDFGTAPATYTQSALSYTNDDPNDVAGPLFSATHSFTVPEQTLGTETLADGTYYWRLAAGGSSYNDLGYLAVEMTGGILAMALVNIGRSFFPVDLVGQPTGAISLGGLGATFDSNTDRLAWVGRSPIADSIAKVYFRMFSVTTGDTVELRIESVTNGRPNGSLLAANTNGTVAIADTDDSAWKTVTLTAPATVTAGQEFAIVIIHSSGATPNEQFCLTGQFVGQFGGQYPLNLQDTGAGTWAIQVNTTSVWEWIVQMTTNGVIPMLGMLPLDGTGAETAFNSGSAPNERALKFQLPFKCRCIGIRAFISNVAAGADFTASLWPASSTSDANALAQAAQDGDFAPSTTNDGYVNLFFAPVTLEKNTVYYAGIRADTANSLAVGEMPSAAGSGTPVVNAMNAFPIPSGGNIYKSHRTWTAGTAGAWTDTTTTLPLISLILDQHIA